MADRAWVQALSRRLRREAQHKLARLPLAWFDAQPPGEVLSRDQLMTLTRGREAMPFERSIDNTIARLRRKVETDPKNPRIIKTVWGGGYRLIVDPSRS